MKIRVFPSHDDTYYSVDVDTDSLESISNIDKDSGSFVVVPVLYLDDLVHDLISQN